MHFVVIGLSHKTAPLNIREKLAVPTEKIPEVLERLIQEEDIQEGMFLSTCNRVEVYLVAKHLQRAAEAAQKILSEWSSVPETDLSKHLYVRNTDEAIAHIFRVVSSLDSMVVGETQISGQVKEAYTHAVAARSVGTYLNRLIHRSLNVSKRIRNETAIGEQPVSISYAAILLAEKIFGDLKETQVLLLGAGEMGELAAKHLIERDVAHLWIANRNEDKGAELASKLGAESVPFVSWKEQLKEIDILITSTAAEGYLVTESDIRAVMHQRKSRPMFLIDIAVPRNIDPAVNQIENVYLYDVDHLKGIVAGNVREREKEARKAEDIVTQEVEKFLSMLSTLELSPTIQQLSKKFEMIRQQEITKYGDDVEACTKAIVNKILHDPIILMKTEEAKDGSPKYSEILKKLFKLEGE